MNDFSHVEREQGNYEEMSKWKGLKMSRDVEVGHGAIKGRRTDVAYTHMMDVL